MKKTPIVILFIFMTLTACDDKKELDYYSNGAPRLERIWVDRESKTCKVKEWYIDSAIKWIGVTKDGIRQYSGLASNAMCMLNVQGRPEFLEMGETYPIRTIVTGVHPDDLQLFGKGCKIERLMHDNYDFEIEPVKTGSIELWVRAKLGSQLFQPCHFQVECKR